jgi:peptidoglycan/xylan/chitin deacetylase (PgdA/CDA1 family)
MPDIQMKKYFIIVIIILLLANCSMLRSKDEIGVEEKTVILTFDDGPNIRHDITERLITVLDRHNVQGVFCFIGKIAEENPDIIRKVYESGHVIVNHSYNHDHPLSLRSEERWEDLIKCDRVFGDILGIEDYKSEYYRPPFGIINNSFKNELLKNNIKLVPASYYVNDVFFGPNRMEELLEDLIIKTEEENCGIIILHEFINLKNMPDDKEYYDNESRHNRSYVPELVDMLIVELIARGYRFGMLRELEL